MAQGVSTAVLVPGVNLGWEATKAPVHSTRIQESMSGRELRAISYEAARYRFRLQWDVARDDRTVVANATPTAPYDELRALMGFFTARKGRFESFLYTDPTDFQVTDQTVIASAPAATTDYQLVRSYGGDVQPIFRANVVSALKVNGVTQGGGTYQVNVPFEGWVRFNVAPSGGVHIQWTGTYYFRVRFVHDEREFSQFMHDLWALRQVELLTVRDA